MEKCILQKGEVFNWIKPIKLSTAIVLTRSGQVSSKMKETIHTRYTQEGTSGTAGAELHQEPSKLT